MSFTKKNIKQQTIENDGMTLHTLLGQLYGRETMLYVLLNHYCVIKDFYYLLLY